MSYAQTKRRDDRPWCGDDVDALGLGTTIAWVMLGAISAAHHGRAIFWAYCESEVSFMVRRTLRRISMNSKKKNLTNHNRV